MGVTAVLVVPNGTHRPGAIGRAILAEHPGWTVGAVWCGDPHLRPRADDAEWFDAGAPLDEALLAGLPAQSAEWVHALDAVAEVIARGSGAVVAWVGSVAVTGSLDELVGPIARGDASAVVVPRWIEGVPADDLAPDARSLTRDGATSPHLAAFGPHATGVVADLRAATLAAAAAATGADDVRMGRVLDLALFGHRVVRCTDPAIGAGAWRWPAGSVGAVVVPGYDVEQPWRLGVEERTPARVELVGHPDRRAVMDVAAPQLAGKRRALRLPGGIPVDAAVRQVGRDHPEVRPWSDPAGFRAVLAEAYWPALRTRRPDLRGAFAGPGGAAFERWRRLAVVDDGTALLIPPVAAATGGPPARVRTIEPPERDGVNVVGYLTRSLGLGEIGRRLAAACAAGGVPTSTVDHRRTQSPAAAVPVHIDDVVRFDTSVAVVNADQWTGLLEDVPTLAGADRRLIGYWFWEAEVVPEVMRGAMRGLDEVWAPTRFVADALSSAGLVPVHLAPLPIPEPHAARLGRRQLAALAGTADRFVFLVTFDHLSVMARKHPLAAIAAYRKAFPADAGTCLVVKTMNAAHRRHDHARLRRAAAGRDDILVWDGELDRGEQMALVAAADCLVSLHRSEGLGLHLAEAMWLGTPTIATRYSGNLDLADDSCAALIDADLVPIAGGDRVYPGTGRWAEPRIDDAVSAMRRMVADASWRASLAAAARARMAAQPTIVDAGRTIAGLLGR